MAKAKYQEKKVIEVVGILDKDEDGELVVMVDESSYPISFILEKSLGMEVSFKASEIEV